MYILFTVWFWFSFYCYYYFSLFWFRFFVENFFNFLFSIFTKNKIYLCIKFPQMFSLMLTNFSFAYFLLLIFNWRIKFVSPLLFTKIGIALQRRWTEAKTTSTTSIWRKLIEATTRIGCSRDGIVGTWIKYDDDTKCTNTEKKTRKIKQS